jgi:hypothetical protein
MECACTLVSGGVELTIGKPLSLEDQRLFLRKTTGALFQKLMYEHANVCLLHLIQTQPVRSDAQPIHNHIICAECPSVSSFMISLGARVRCV